MDLHDYLHFVSYSKSLEELWPAHTKQMAQFGFERLIYGCTRFRTEHSLGEPEDFIILSNHDPEYVKGFVDDGLYFHAPMLQWALENEGAESWSRIGRIMASEGLSPQAQRVYDFNARMGVTVGYTISFTSVSARSKGAISLAAGSDRSQEDVEAMWKEHGDDILLMNNMAHLKILSLPYSAPKRSLTGRQREALEWVGDGKTMQDIATIMGLTTPTVEKHLRLARQSLKVDTTAQAVLKAALHNQMYILQA